MNFTFYLFYNESGQLQESCIEPIGWQQLQILCDFILFTVGDDSFHTKSISCFASPGTIMAYGQTGAGKTFTMTGATENYQQRGIIPRALSQLFMEIDDRPDYAINLRSVS